MRKICVFWILLVLMFFLCFIECNKNENKAEKNRRLKKRQIDKIKWNNQKRNRYNRLRRNDEGGEGEGNEGEAKGKYNTSFVPLKIFLDLTNFNYTFPNNTFDEVAKDNFIEAMNRAKNILETYLYIEIDYDFVNIITEDYFEIFFVNYSSKMLINTTLHDYNFFILFRFFSDEDEPIACFDIAIEDASTPYGGVISINEIMGSNQYTNVEYLTNLMLHQFIHLLGFNSYTLYQSNLTLEISETTFKKETFPNLINYAQKYFNSTDIEEIEVELDDVEYISNFHFSSRLLLGELMTSFSYPEEQILSGFTLALLNDLKHIKVINNYTGGLMRFGKHKGYSFVDSDCEEDFDNKNFIFANEFCLPKDLSPIPSQLEPSCSSGRLSKTFHMYHSDAPDYPRPEIIDYCPISEFNGLNSEDIYIGHCYKEYIADNELQNIIKESFTPNSFCVLSSLIPSEVSAELKIRAVCYEMYCSSKSLTIKIGDEYLVCPRSGGKIEAKNLSGFLLCPDYNLICTGKEVCNSNYDCFTKHSEEKAETFFYDYDIKTTQYSVDYINSSPIYGYELGDDGKCPYMCSQCNSTKICINCGPHYMIDENNNNKACIEKDPNCVSYLNDDDDFCHQCKTGYSLAKDDTIYLCVSDLDKHFFAPDSSDSDYPYKIRCNKRIDNCDTCESKTKCTKCLDDDNYKPVDGITCLELSTKTFYFDETEEQYKYCTYKDSKCSKCQLNTDNNFECLECESGYALFHEGTEPIICTDKEEKTLDKYYSEDEGNNYYPCNNAIQYCDTCLNKQVCKSCSEPYDLVTVNNINNKLCIKLDEKKYYQDSDNNNYYFLCETSLSNCLTCDSKTKCNSCKDDFGIEEHDICISKSSPLYYLDSTINKYVLCSSRISNCKSCTSSDYCVECNENFAIIGTDHSKCEDLSTKKYYKDTDNLYHQCSYKKVNCETCRVDGNNNFICEKCEATYAFKHNSDNSIQCGLKSELESNNEYYTNDSGLNFYSCSNSLFNDILNCKECSSKDSCSKCKDYYKLVNNNTKCYLQSDINNNIVHYNPNTGLYSPCSELIFLCQQCENENNCTKCGEEGRMVEDNSCISNESVSNGSYTLDETTGKYVSCSIIDNCVTCSSKTLCTKCEEGYNINGGNCQIISNSKDDNNKKLSTGAIIGIVFGCVGFLLIVAGVVYFLLNKAKSPIVNYTKAPEDNIEIREEGEKKDEEVAKSTKRRSIHNA